jgi:hypothetical protein
VIWIDAETPDARRYSLAPFDAWRYTTHHFRLCVYLRYVIPIAVKDVLETTQVVMEPKLYLSPVSIASPSSASAGSADLKNVPAKSPNKSTALVQHHQTLGEDWVSVDEPVPEPIRFKALGPNLPAKLYNASASSSAASSSSSSSALTLPPPPALTSVLSIPVHLQVLSAVSVMWQLAEQKRFQAALEEVRTSALLEHRSKGLEWEKSMALLSPVSSAPVPATGGAARAGLVAGAVAGAVVAAPVGAVAAGAAVVAVGAVAAGAAALSALRRFSIGKSAALASPPPAPPPAPVPAPAPAASAAAAASGAAFLEDVKQERAKKLDQDLAEDKKELNFKEQLIASRFSAMQSEFQSLLQFLEKKAFSTTVLDAAFWIQAFAEWCALYDENESRAEMEHNIRAFRESATKVSASLSAENFSHLSVMQTMKLFANQLEQVLRVITIRYLFTPDS